MRQVCRAPRAVAPRKVATSVPRRAASTKSDVQTKSDSSLSGERAAQREVMRVHRRFVLLSFFFCVRV